MGQTTAYEVMRDAQKLFVELQKENLKVPLKNLYHNLKNFMKAHQIKVKT